MLRFGFPGVAALFGLIACVGSFLPGRWQRIPSCCAAVCACSLGPLLLLIVGVVLVPSAMVGADVCSSAASLGVLVGQNDYAGLCDMMGGTTIPGPLCQVTVVQASGSMGGFRFMDGSTSSRGVRHFAPTPRGVLGSAGTPMVLTFNISALSTELLSGQCSGDLSNLWADAGTQAANAVVSRINVSIAQATRPGRGFAVRPGVIDTVLRGTMSAGADIADLGSALSHAWGCRQIYEVWQATHSTVCCQFLYVACPRSNRQSISHRPLPQAAIFLVGGVVVRRFFSSLLLWRQLDVDGLQAVPCQACVTSCTSSAVWLLVWCGVLTAVVGSWRHCADQRDEAIFQPVSPEDSPLPFTQADRRSFTTLQLQSTSETTPLLTAGATAVAVPPATASGPPPSGATVAGANTYDAPDWAAARPTPAPVRAALPPSAPPLHVASENGKSAKLVHH